MNTSRRCLLALPLSLTLCLNFLASPALASKPRNISKAEMALLPKYCPDTQGFGYGDAHYNTSPRAPRWVEMMGPGFWHLHHYCWGLIQHQRAMKINASAVERKGNLENAISNYLYVIERVDDSFVLLPEIFTRMGDAELKLGRAERAEEAYRRARELKPDYWPAYSRWAEYLIAKKKLQEARILIEEGLAFAPTARPLREQYRLVGGDPEKLDSRHAITARRNEMTQPSTASTPAFTQGSE